MQVVEHLYRRTQPGFVPVPGDYFLRRVDRSPRWFDRGPYISSEDESVLEPASFRAESGLPVDLRLSDV